MEYNSFGLNTALLTPEKRTYLGILCIVKVLGYIYHIAHQETLQETFSYISFLKFDLFVKSISLFKNNKPCLKLSSKTVMIYSVLFGP